VKDAFRVENLSLREQLSSAVAKVESVSNRSLQIEYIQEKLSGILNEIEI
jgi:hypothetical protein